MSSVNVELDSKTIEQEKVDNLKLLVDEALNPKFRSKTYGEEKSHGKMVETTDGLVSELFWKRQPEAKRVEFRNELRKVIKDLAQDYEKAYLELNMTEFQDVNAFLTMVSVIRSSAREAKCTVGQLEYPKNQGTVLIPVSEDVSKRPISLDDDIEIELIKKGPVIVPVEAEKLMPEDKENVGVHTKNDILDVDFLDEEVKAGARKLTEIEPIELSAALIIENKAMIKKIVEAPLVPICEALYDLNIMTSSSNANVKNLSEVNVHITRNTLSKENNEIVDRLVKESGEFYELCQDKGSDPYVSLKMKADENTTEPEILEHFTELVSNFKEQDVMMGVYNLDEMKKICGYGQDEYMDPKAAIEAGYAYSERLNKFYYSEELKNKSEVYNSKNGDDLEIILY